jgi:hypothetical protein
VLRKTLPPVFCAVGLIEERFSITFSNGRKFSKFIAGVEREGYYGLRERATVVARITLAEELAHFYKKIWPREVAKTWGLTWVAKTGARR